MRTALTCGPESFLHDVQQHLLALGCPPERLHRESFTFPDPALSLALEDAPAADHLHHSGFDIEFLHLARTVHSPAGSTVLQAAAAAGITLPSSCSQGLCGTCKSVLVSGEVDMQHAGGIRPKEISKRSVPAVLLGTAQPAGGRPTVTVRPPSGMSGRRLRSPPAAGAGRAGWCRAA